MTYSITKNGIELRKDLYTIDEETKTFSSSEHGLVLDFSDENKWTFTTGSDCTFDTGGYCTFKTCGDCMFAAGSNCTFDTGSNCTFDTGSDCVLVRRDIYEVIEIPADTTIKLHGYEIVGYEVIEKEACAKLDVEEIKKKIFDLIEKLTRVEE